MLYRHKMSLFSQAKGPAQGPASSLRSIFTSALCLPVSTWLNSTGSTRIFLPDPGLLDNCHCCPSVCDRYGYYVLCWRLVMVRRPQKVEILLSSRCTSRPVGSTSQTPSLPPGSKTARFILDDRSHWFGTVPSLGMVNGRVFPTLKVSAPVIGMSADSLMGGKSGCLVLLWTLPPRLRRLLLLTKLHQHWPCCAFHLSFIPRS